jgi:hypothetical protein
MIDINKKYKVILLSSLLLFFIGILGGCSKQDSSEASIYLASSISSINKIVVVVRNNELNLINLNDTKNIITLDKDGAFAHPIIAPDKSFIAYLKDSNLYISNKEGVKSKVVDNINISSYIWLDNNNLIYSKDATGIYIYNTEKQSSTPYIENEFNYKNLTLGKNREVYAEKYKTYEKEGKKSIEDFGVVLISLDNKNEKIIIKSIPSDMKTNPGMYPVIAGISKDFKFLFIWEHPHSGSLAADGMSLACYNTESNQYIKYSNPDIVTLGYKDNLATSETNSEMLALIQGDDRMMNTNKTLGILNVANGSFEKLSPGGQIAMTPYYSEDGKTLLYAASEKVVDGTGNTSKWLSSPHYIYSINTETKQVTQLTQINKSMGGFDFAPEYINDKDFVFLRSTSKDDIALWKIENGKESKIIDNLLFYTDQIKAQNYYGHFYNDNFIDIK